MVLELSTGKDGDRYEEVKVKPKKVVMEPIIQMNRNKLTGNFIDDDATGKFKVTFLEK